MILQFTGIQPLIIFPVKAPNAVYTPKKSDCINRKIRYKKFKSKK